MKRIKEYFAGECVEPKTQDKIVEQLKNVSEPTYMLAKAIDGVVKVYGKITTIKRLSAF